MSFGVVIGILGASRYGIAAMEDRTVDGHYAIW
jgi:hypothetical protein